MLTEGASLTSLRAGTRLKMELWFLGLLVQTVGAALLSVIFLYLSREGTASSRPPAPGGSSSASRPGSDWPVLDARGSCRGGGGLPVLQDRLYIVRPLCGGHPHGAARSRLVKAAQPSRPWAPSPSRSPDRPAGSGGDSDFPTPCTWASSPSDGLDSWRSSALPEPPRAGLGRRVLAGAARAGLTPACPSRLPTSPGSPSRPRRTIAPARSSPTRGSSTSCSRCSSASA